MAKPKNELVIKLFETLDQKKISVPEFSDIIGIPKDRIYKWKQRDASPKADDSEKVRAWLDGNGLDNFPRETKKLENKGTLESSEPLYELIASNRALADAALVQAQRDKIKAEADKIREEKEKVLVQSNADLASLLKSTAHEPGYNLLGHPYIVKKLLETLAELGTGTLWKTKEDGLILLGNRLSLPDDEEEMKGGTRGAVGKKSIVRQH